MVTVAETVACLEADGVSPGQIFRAWADMDEEDRGNRFALNQLSDRMMRCMGLLRQAPPAFIFGMDEARQARYVVDAEYAEQVRSGLEHRRARLEEMVRCYRSTFQLGPVYGRVARFARWWSDSRAVLLDSLEPWTTSPLRVDPGDRLRDHNRALEAYYAGAERDVDRPERYAQFLQALAHYFYRHGYCMYQGSFYVTVPGTGGHALSRLVEAVDDEQEEVAASMSAKAVVWRAIEDLPDVYRTVLENKTALGEVEQMIHLIRVAGPRSRIIAQARPSYRLFAFPPHGALQIALPPSRKRGASGALRARFTNGTMVPTCELLSFDELPADVVTIRNLSESEDTWTPGAPDMPLGWLRLRRDHALVRRPDPPSNSEEGLEYQRYLREHDRERRRHWLNQAEDEPDFAWLRRFAAQFERVERAGDEYRTWLQNHETYHVADLWEAWDGVWGRWVEGLPPHLRGIDMTPPERTAAYRRWAWGRWLADIPFGPPPAPPAPADPADPADPAAPPPWAAPFREQAAAEGVELPAEALAHRLPPPGLEPPAPAPPNPFEGTLLGVCGAALHVMAMQRYSDQQMAQLWTMVGKSLYWGKLCTNWQLLTLFQGLSRTGKGILLDLLQDFFGYEGCHTVEEKKGDKYSMGDANRKRVLIMSDIGSFGANGLTEEEVLRMVAHELFAARRMQEMQDVGMFMPHILFATNNPKLMESRMALGTRVCQFNHWEDVLKAGRSIGYLARWRRRTTGANLCLAVRCLMRAYDAIGPAGSMQTYMPAACRDTRLRMRATRDFAAFFDPANGWVAWDLDASTPVAAVLDRLRVVRTGPDVVEARPSDPDFENALREFHFTPAGDEIVGLRLTDRRDALWRGA